MEDLMIDNIYIDILELSDLERQKEYWLGGNANYISSYIEVMCRLFDENHFDKFVDCIAIQKGFDENLVNELNVLRQLLNAYAEEGKNDEEIIGDPLWHKVVKQASIVISLWKRNKT